MNSRGLQALVGLVAIAVIAVGGVRVATHHSSRAKVSSASPTHPAPNSQPSRSSAPSPASPSGPGQAVLNTELLSISAFPAGWHTTPVDDSGSGGGTFHCSSADRAAKGSADAEADFASGSIETITNLLASYSSVAAAQAAFTQSETYFKSCTGAELEGSKFTIGQLSFGPAGQQDFGLSIDGSIDGVNVGVQFVYALQGAVIAQIEHADIEPVDTTLTSSLLAASVRAVGTGTA